MANFCSKCGTAIDQQMGLCPNCDAEKISAIKAQAVASNVAVAEKIEVVAQPSIQQPVVQAPIVKPVQEAPVKQPKAPKKARNSKIVTLISVLLAIFLFITASCSVIIYTVRNAVTRDTIEQILDETDVIDILDDVGGSKAINRFYNELESRYDLEITDSKLNSFMKKSEINSFLAKKAARFSEDFFEGDAQLKIKKSELVEILYEERELIYNKFGTYLNRSQIEDIVSMIMKEDELVVIDTDELEGNAEAAAYLVGVCFSKILMYIFIVLSIIIIAVMFVNNYLQAMNGTGIIFTIIGGIGSLLALVVAIPAVLGMISENSGIVGLAGTILTSSSSVSIIMLVVGVLLLVGRGIILKIRDKKQNTAVNL